MWRHVAWPDKSISAATFWMVGSEMVENNTRDPLCVISMFQAAAGGVMVLGVFSWHNVTDYLNTVVDHIYPFMIRAYSSSDGCFTQHIMSQSSNPFKLVSWQWVVCTRMTFTVIRCQSNQAPLGCGETGDSHHGCTADKAAGLSVVMTIWTKISEACFQECFVDSRQQRIKPVLKATGVQPTTSKV